ncbi:RiPP maturation radical SAM C-methyltransferase [Phytohabitans sp. LJ34]|uniref:RiPP maturation radical SAM C-methyltransferase n=1 Tax=Phytohabitans sp. LJ34 TaxID=3452217 RepID=UPI003F88C16B
MRLLLVNMPWGALDLPSLALGILKNSAAEKYPDATVEVWDANIDYFEWVLERRPFNGYDYQYYGLETYFSGFGDWIFSSALYDDPMWRIAEFDRYATRKGKSYPSNRIAMARELHGTTPEFIHQLAERVVRWRPDIVGFTTTFQQNVAALAAAKHVKRLDPRITTVFGGANCDSEQGVALHRNFTFVDFVIRGEGEVSFPKLLDAIDQKTTLDTVDSLCWRAADGTPVANPMSARPLAPKDIVSPEFTGYFERIARSPAMLVVEPKLVVEGARGCWWGEKHHCTFCGLNGSSMAFRSKSPVRFFDEIEDLVRRHKVLDVVVVDNIMDMSYVTSLLPRLAESGYTLRMHYEIKSNMRRPQLELLRDAGVVNVQPGIESLSTRVLKLMDKGVSGCQNVRMLRDAAALGLTVAWNFLVGFPGETEADYLPVIRQLGVLHHLMPCGGATRIALERFSPYFNRPELGFADRRADEQYALIYDLPDEELEGLAYLFTAPEQGIGEATLDLLRTGLAEWADAHLESELAHCDLGDSIVLVNRRRHFPWRTLRIDDPVEAAVFRLLDQPHGVAALARKATAQTGVTTSEPDVADLLDRWRELGLVFTDADQFVHVVPEATNYEMLRLPSALPVDPPAMDEAATAERREEVVPV